MTILFKSVKYKYPKEFNNLNYGFLIFDLVEMVGDELAKKNMNLFIEPYIEQLANIKDISLGETFEFSVEQ